MFAYVATPFPLGRPSVYVDAHMPIPAFAQDGNLPLGAFYEADDTITTFSGHDATMAEIEAVLVDPYPGSLQRPKLFAELRMLLSVALRSLPCVTILVSGEFVREVEEPGHLLAILLATDDDWEQLDNLDRWVLQRLFDGADWQCVTNFPLNLKTQLVIVYPDGHARHERSRADQLQARYDAGAIVEDPEHVGYLEMFECGEGVNDLADLDEEIKGALEAPPVS